MIPTSYISAAVEGYVLSRPDKVYDYISPSSLGGCLRAHYFKLQGIKSTTPPTTAAQTNFMVGRVWEGFMAKCLEHAGILSKWYRDGVDDPFYMEELNLGGLPDFLLKTPGGLIVADGKTMRSEWFWYRRKKPQSMVMADDRQYQMQGGAYIMLLRNSGLDVQRAALAFASKDDGFIGAEYEFELTAALEAEIRARCNILNNCLAIGKAPKCECEGWKVGYCDFGDPLTRTKNKKGKEINSTCCSLSLEVKEEVHA